MKPENIFICSDNVVKIIDFGLATNVLTGTLNEGCGSIHYIAPEVFLQDGYSRPVDTWAIAIIG